MTISERTANYISKPSWSDGSNYESRYTEALSKDMNDAAPWLEETRQDIAPNRQNLFYTDGYPCKLLIINHTDTVPPSDQWTSDPCTPIITKESITGLGATDTKGNTAACIDALQKHGPTKGVSVLWYADEEYDFAGMKAFVQSELAQTITPEMVLSVDGNGLTIGSACRGLYECTLSMKSKSEHSSRKASITLFEQFEWIVQQIRTRVCSAGSTSSLNVASIAMGSGDASNDWTSSANKTPSYLDATIEIRTNASFDEAEVLAIFERCPEYIELSSRTIHNIPGYDTDTAQLSTIESAVSTVLGEVTYTDASTFGYLDLAMLQQIYPKASLGSFGAGTIGQSHRPDESVLHADLSSASAVYQLILEQPS